MTPNNAFRSIVNRCFSQLLLACLVALSSCGKSSSKAGIEKRQEKANSGAAIPDSAAKSRESARDSALGTVETAAALHAEGLRRGDDEALPCFAEAYRIRRSRLGPFDTNTYTSLQALTDCTLRRGDLQEGLRLLLELRTATTNVLRGEQAKQRLIVTASQLTHLYDQLSMTAERDATKKNWYQLLGMSEEEVAARLRLEETVARQPTQTITAAEIQKRMEPILAAAQTNQDPIFNEQMKRTLEDPTMRAMLKGGAQMTRALYEQLGYSEAQLKEIDKIQTEQAKWMNEMATKARNGTLTMADVDSNPIGKLHVSLPAGGALNFSNAAQSMNLGRRIEAAMATRDPENYQLLRKAHVFGPPRESVEKWFRNEWDHWNEAFEAGEPFNQVLGRKQWHGPFSQLSTETETNGMAMCLLALNLKGLVLDRELRLQSALAMSDDPAVVEWRTQLWESQVEAMRTRPKSIDIASYAQNPRMKLPELLEAVEEMDKDVEANGKAVKAQQQLRVFALALPKAGRKPIVSADAVKTALPDEGVLIEFLRYGRDFGGTNMIEEIYGAVVLSKRSDPKWVHLSPANDVDSLIKRYVESIRQKTPVPNHEMNHLLESLYSTIWAPLKPALGERSKAIFLAPDGQLQLLSFATLRAGGHFLGEQHDLRYVIGGRDMVEKSASRTPSKRVEVWVNPDFDAGSAPTTREKGRNISSLFTALLFQHTRERGLLDVRMDALAGTDLEAAMLRELAEKHGNLPVRVHRKDAVTESELTKVEQPFILHVGTHGFFLPAESPTAQNNWLRVGPREEYNVDVALYRSGLALSGATKTLNAWRQQSIPAPPSDGILTAAEAAQMNLHGTWLVTLSACDAGIGQVVDGECVLSLKLGFLQAGAQNLLYSLWRLNDNYVKGAFYEEALKSGNPAAALSKTQGLELKNLAAANTPHALWQSVKFAGPFVMNVRGN